MIVEITLLIVAGLGNLAWDVTGRRVSARSRRNARRARRSHGLPVAIGEPGEDPLAVDQLAHHAPVEFLELTRRTLEELDRVVDHFDLILLRAEAGESLIGDIVYVGAEAPRDRGKQLLDAWLVAVDELALTTREHLRELGLPDATLRELLASERKRGQWPNAGTASNLLEQTAKDFERAVVLLLGFLRALHEVGRSPYR